MDFVATQNVKIPALGLGTWDLRGKQARQAVASALAMGYRHIDTAEMYGNEEEVGAGINDSGVPRTEIFLTTKVWSDYIGYGDLKKHAAASLERLKTGYVDLLLIHWPNARIPLKDSIKALVEVCQSGAAKNIGVSNFPVAMMKEACEVLRAPVVCNQVEFHPYLNQDAVLDYARSRDMFVTAYCPLARGEVADDPTIQAIAQKHGKTPGQITLRWLTQQKNIVAIPKAASEKHQRENLDVFNFKLSGEEMKSISSLARPDGRIVTPAGAPQWDRAA